MIVCLCNAISEHEIIQAAYEGASTLEHLSERFNLGVCCGACMDCAADCLASAKVKNTKDGDDLKILVNSV